MAAAAASLAPEIHDALTQCAGGELAHARERLGVRTGDEIVERRLDARRNRERELLHHVEFWTLACRTVFPTATPASTSRRATRWSRPSNRTRDARCAPKCSRASAASARSARFRKNISSRCWFPAPTASA